MTQFLCITIETTGIAPGCGILELGWILFDPTKPDEGDGNVYLVDPGDAVFEPVAEQMHMKSGLLEEFATEPTTSLEQIAKDLTPPAGTEKPFLVLWSKGFVRNVLEGTPVEKVFKGHRGELDFGTLNWLRTIYTANELLRPAESRAVAKLAVMRKALVDWQVLFHLAVAK